MQARAVLRGALSGVLVVLVCVAVPAPTAADTRMADYAELLQWEFSAPVAIPAGGIEVQIDAARFQLVEGTMRLQSPVASGASHGFVFEGRGSFSLTVPDPLELRQLRRFAEAPDLEAIDVEFTALVAKTSDPELFGQLAATGPYGSLGLASDRYGLWLRQEFLDADSRLVEAGSDPGGAFARLDVRTERWGWLSFTWDTRQAEEIELSRFDRGHKAMESWVSLDRAEERRADGRPSGVFYGPFELPRVSVSIDVTDRARQSPRGFSDVQPVRAGLRAELHVIAGVANLSALRLALSPRAEVRSVTSEAGAQLEFIRDHIGKRSAGIDNDLYDDSMLVLLREPLALGEELKIEVEYEMRLDGYAPGRSWYPGPDGPVRARLAPHQPTFTLKLREDQEVRASGVVEWEGDGQVRWAHERPVKMASFATTSRGYETSHALQNTPVIRTFSSLGGFMNEERVEQVGADVASAAFFFQQLFADPLLDKELRVALIPSFHGQAFDGFLHVGDFTVAFDNLAATTMFRAHEVAHQWWGHRLFWASYRDQWLSEAFAEYSAMVFIHDSVEGGSKEFYKILEAYTDEVTGSLKSEFSSYSRPDYVAGTKLALKRIGPIGHGVRCHVGEAPSSYFLQTYLKGPLVLHMLRVLVGHMTRDPDTFFEILRTFVRKHAGGAVTTDDFIAVVEEVVPADWSWFFDQWIYSAEIPSYTWSYDVVRGDTHAFELRLQVRQEDVPPGFRMAVPVRVEFGKDKVGTVLAFVDKPESEFVFPLPEKPRKVEFNPDHAVLAKVKKR